MKIKCHYLVIHTSRPENEIAYYNVLVLFIPMKFSAWPKCSFSADCRIHKHIAHC